MIIRIIIAILFLLISGCKDTHEINAKIVNYGIIETKNVEVEDDNELVAGVVKVFDSWKIINQTTTIPNKEKIQFGLEYEIINSLEDFIEVEEIMIFPGEGLTNPQTGLTSKIDTEKAEIYTKEIRVLSYIFDNNWERKSGKWIFQLKYQNRLLLEKIFFVN